MQFLCRILKIFRKICCSGTTDIIMNHSDAFSSDSPVFFQVLARKAHRFRASESRALGKSRKYRIRFVLFWFFFKANAF